MFLFLAAADEILDNLAFSVLSFGKKESGHQLC
jgi:hypothetical protein